MSDRKQLLAEIAQLEERIAELQGQLPPVVKRFYKFIGSPFRSMLVYAEDENIARRIADARLSVDYPLGFNVHPVVTTFTDPLQAALNNSSAGLFSSLSAEDAAEFVKDWREQGNELPPRGCRLNCLERDIDAYERRLRAKAMSV